MVSSVILLVLEVLFPSPCALLFVQADVPDLISAPRGSIVEDEVVLWLSRPCGCLGHQQQGPCSGVVCHSTRTSLPQYHLLARCKALFIMNLRWSTCIYQKEKHLTVWSWTYGEKSKAGDFTVSVNYNCLYTVIEIIVWDFFFWITQRSGALERIKILEEIAFVCALFA